jgi:ATP-dependent DNA helicase RecQ
MVLFEELRIIRRKVAKRLNLPTFQIFPDKVLQEMATNIPENEEEMEKLKGVGKTKMELYGKKFIDAIKEYKRKKGVMGE